MGAYVRDRPPHSANFEIVAEPFAEGVTEHFKNRGHGDVAQLRLRPGATDHQALVPGSPQGNDSGSRPGPAQAQPAPTGPVW
jgi:hypothetical protein